MAKAKALAAINLIIVFLSPWLGPGPEQPNGACPLLWPLPTATAPLPRGSGVLSWWRVTMAQRHPRQGLPRLKCLLEFPQVAFSARAPLVTRRFVARLDAGPDPLARACSRP